MREFTTAFIAEKNKLDNRRPWAALVEIEITPNTTAFFTTYPETLSMLGNVYAPVNMDIGTEESASDGSIPSMFVSVANVGGYTFRFARDNELTLNQCVLKTVNVAISTSGSQAMTKMQISTVMFANEVARFTLDIPINKDLFGPKRIYDRTTYPSIPFAFKNYALV